MSWSHGYRVSAMTRSTFLVRLVILLLFALLPSPMRQAGSGASVSRSGNLVTSISTEFTTCATVVSLGIRRDGDGIWTRPRVIDLAQPVSPYHHIAPNGLFKHHPNRVV